MNERRRGIEKHKYLHRYTFTALRADDEDFSFFFFLDETEILSRLHNFPSLFV